MARWTRKDASEFADIEAVKATHERGGAVLSRLGKRERHVLSQLQDIAEIHWRVKGRLCSTIRFNGRDGSGFSVATYDDCNTWWICC